jgi:RNA polymerase sigma-70 factor (ECF subfamily)
MARLYRRHGATVFRLSWLMTGSEAAAADVVQDTYMALFNRPNRFDPARGSCVAYLCGIARHLAARQADPRAASTADIEVLAQGDAADGDSLPPLPLAAAERAEGLARLYAAIRRLPPHYRDVLVLAELQELSYAEVAAVAGIELGTVRSRLARARERLRELLLAESTGTTEGSEYRS